MTHLLPGNRTQEGGAAGGQAGRSGDHYTKCLSGGGVEEVTGACGFPCGVTAAARHVEVAVGRVDQG